MKSIRFAGLVALTALPCLLLVGCGKGQLKTYPAKGKVVFADGSPVKVGTIECKSFEHGVQATGTIDTDGSFVLTTYRDGDGAVAGNHKCVIVQFIPTENIPNFKPSPIGVVDRKFSSYATSELRLKISTTEPNDNLRIEVTGVGSGTDHTPGAEGDHGHEVSSEAKPN